MIVSYLEVVRENEREEIKMGRALTALTMLTVLIVAAFPVIYAGVALA